MTTSGDGGRGGDEATTRKGGMTKQGVRDLNHRAPRRPKDALDDRAETRPKPAPPEPPLGETS